MIRVFLLALLFSPSVWAVNFLCTIHRADSQFQTIPLTVRPESSVLYLFGQNIFQNRVYYFRDQVDLLDFAGQKAAWRPQWYNDSQFVAVHRPSRELTLHMMLGQIKNSTEVSAGVKFRRFSEKGSQQEIFADGNLTMNCEAESR